MKMRAYAGVVVGALLMLAAPGEAQLAEFLGPHAMETLPYEIPGTGRIGGVTVDGYGYLYIANQDERVWKIHPSGEMEVILDGLYGSASGVVMRNAELLHTAWGGDEIWRVERNGTRHLVAEEGLEGPVGIVMVDEYAYTVNAKSNWVARVSMDGTVEEFARDDRMRQANGITADPQGNLYVVSLGNTVVLKIDPQGVITEIATLPGTANGHVAYVGDALYVTQIWEHVVLRVEMDGSYQVVAGDGTRDTLPFPNGIAAARRGDAVYFNTLDGSMINGAVGVIRIHKLSLPAPARAFEVALDEGGISALKAKFDAGLELREASPAQLVPAYYGVGEHLLRIGRSEAGLAMMDWTADIDTDEARSSLKRGRAHMIYGDRSKAIEALERAAALSPENEKVGHMLEAAKTYRN